MTPPNVTEERDRRDEQMERILLVAALVFLLAYALPIIKPTLPHAVIAGCQVVLAAVWVLFISDMLIRLIRSDERGEYLRHNWPAMLAAVIPTLRPAVALIVLGRRNHRFVRGRVVLSVLMATTLICGMSALTVLKVEGNLPDANIRTIGDALWWSAVTVSTVGYGDHYPITFQGRFAALLLMTTGVGLVGVISASLASWFVERVSDSEAADERAEAAPDSEIPSGSSRVEGVAAEQNGCVTMADLMAEIKELRDEVAQLRPQEMESR